ncbi:MAG: 4Fe-4S dicluster domain-containing protein [Kiritimatiellales bacterium]
MNIQHIHSVFFSPTHTTQRIVQAITRGTGMPDVMEHDITMKEPAPEMDRLDQKDLLIVGLPVYAGRIPGLAIRRLKNLKGRQTPAVAVTVYGNRAYDDALIELCDLCDSSSFKIIGAGAFIGQHSFSSLKNPIAHDRPDEKDIRLAETFGRQVRRLLQSSDPVKPLQLSMVPGSHSYRPGMNPSGAAGDSDPAQCIQCGQCIEHCPAHAIRMENGAPETDPDNCIWCAACVQNCPTGARQITQPKIGEISERLSASCRERREPEWFLASA